MKIGRLNKRATFLAPQVKPDGIGGRAREWAAAFTCWADVRPPRVREQLAAGIPAAKLTTDIIIRKSSNVPARGWRVEVDGARYEVVAVVPFGSNGYSVACESVVS